MRYMIFFFYMLKPYLTWAFFGIFNVGGGGGGQYSPLNKTHKNNDFRLINVFGYFGGVLGYFWEGAHIAPHVSPYFFYKIAPPPSSPVSNSCFTKV